MFNILRKEKRRQNNRLVALVLISVCMNTGVLDTEALPNKQVEVLGSVVSSIAKIIGVNSVIDVGAGQVLILLIVLFNFLSSSNV